MSRALGRCPGLGFGLLRRGRLGEALEGTGNLVLDDVSSKTAAGTTKSCRGERSTTTSGTTMLPLGGTRSPIRSGSRAASTPSHMLLGIR